MWSKRAWKFQTSNCENEVDNDIPEDDEGLGVDEWGREQWGLTQTQGEGREATSTEIILVLVETWSGFVFISIMRIIISLNLSFPIFVRSNSIHVYKSVGTLCHQL